jgi:hypothetical protein
MKMQKINSQNNQNKIEIPAAREGLDFMKIEIAKELGIEIPRVGNAYDFRMVPSFYNGAIGGEIVKRTTQYVQKMIAEGNEDVWREILAKGREEGEGNVPHVGMHAPLTPFNGPTPTEIVQNVGIEGQDQVH